MLSGVDVVLLNLNYFTESARLWKKVTDSVCKVWADGFCKMVARQGRDC